MWTNILKAIHLLTYLCGPKWLGSVFIGSTLTPFLWRLVQYFAVLCNKHKMAGRAYLYSDTWTVRQMKNDDIQYTEHLHYTIKLIIIYGITFCTSMMLLHSHTYIHAGRITSWLLCMMYDAMTQGANKSGVYNIQPNNTTAPSMSTVTWR